MAAFEAWLVLLVVNVGELQRKRTLAASRGFLAAARLSCFVSGYVCWIALTTFSCQSTLNQSNSRTASYHITDGLLSRCASHADMQ